MNKAAIRLKTAQNYLDTASELMPNDHIVHTIPGCDVKEIEEIAAENNLHIYHPFEICGYPYYHIDVIKDNVKITVRSNEYRYRHRELEEI